jgi:hypothetical protein
MVKDGSQSMAEDTMMHAFYHLMDASVSLDTRT